MKLDLSSLKRSLLLLFIPILIHGCTPPPGATLPATPSLLHVSITSTVLPLQEALSRCARAQPEIALVLAEMTAEEINLQQTDLALVLGSPFQGDGFAAPLANELVSFVANPENPVRSLKVEELRSLFAGDTTHWADLNGEDQAVEIWVLPTGNESSQVVDQAVIDRDKVSSQAFLAPGPREMLRAIAANPGAIGYLPNAWLTDSVYPIQIQGALEPLQRPVLALAAEEPEGEAREFLFCLQNGTGQQVIQEAYSQRRGS